MVHQIKVEKIDKDVTLSLLLCYRKLELLFFGLALFNFFLKIILTILKVKRFTNKCLLHFFNVAIVILQWTDYALCSGFLILVMFSGFITFSFICIFRQIYL